MVKIKAFAGFRPQPDKAKAVAAKPYDVLSSAEAREEAKDNPHSFLRVVKPEITLPEDIDPYAPAVYAQAKANFDTLVNNGVLFQDDTEKLYVYRQIWKEYAQTGLVAASSIDDYFSDHIKKHEYTRPKKEQDRIDHMYASGIHSGPVFLTYKDVGAIDAIIEKITAEAPDYDFEADDNVRHTLWVINDAADTQALISQFAESVPATYIADGHHRAASSAKVGTRMREELGTYTGEEPFNYFLSVLFPASQLNIIDYNRVVKDLNGLDKDIFLTALDNQFYVTPEATAFVPAQQHQFGLYLDRQWYKLIAKEGSYEENDPVNGLDVAILQQNVLDAILDIKDPRTDDRVDFVGGIRGLQELEQRVNSGEMAAAFSLYPVSIEQLMRIADEGMVMPPKSTWFEPKLRSGMVVHQFRK